MKDTQSHTSCVICREMESLIHARVLTDPRTRVGETLNSLASSPLFLGSVFWERGIESDPTLNTRLNSGVLQRRRKKKSLLPWKENKKTTSLAPLTTRKIIKCNERRRFVAFHFNCVGCGRNRARAVCVDFRGGFCCVCIPRTKNKNVGGARRLVFNDRRRDLF